MIQSNPKSWVINFYHIFIFWRPFYLEQNDIIRIYGVYINNLLSLNNLTDNRNSIIFGVQSQNAAIVWVWIDIVNRKNWDKEILRCLKKVEGVVVEHKLIQWYCSWIYNLIISNQILAQEWSTLTIYNKKRVVKRIIIDFSVCWVIRGTI